MTEELPMQPGRVPVGELRALVEEWEKQRTGNRDVDKSFERAAERLREVIDRYGSPPVVFRYAVTPCDCGSRSFEPADPVRCMECGNLADEVAHRELPDNATVEIDVEIIDRYE